MSVISLLRSGKGPMDGWVARAYDRGVQAAFREIFPKLVEDLLDEMRGVRRALDVGCGPASAEPCRPTKRAPSSAARQRRAKRAARWFW